MFGLGYSHFARRYFGNHACFLFLKVLRCFSSLRSPLLPMDSVIDILELPRMGSPIQRSPDQSLLSGYPKLIAASHVFHRHPAPRHPPSALSSLAIALHHSVQSQSETFSAFEIAFPVFSFQRANRVSALSQVLRTKSWNMLRIQLLVLIAYLVEVNGLEPMTPSLQSWCSPC
jgi:hypothetical protein